MLMMLGVGAASGEKGGPADAHDAGRARIKDLGEQCLMSRL